MPFLGNRKLALVHLFVINFEIQYPEETDEQRRKRRV